MQTEIQIYKNAKDKNLIVYVTEENVCDIVFNILVLKATFIMRKTTEFLREFIILLQIPFIWNMHFVTFVFNPIYTLFGAFVIL